MKRSVQPQSQRTSVNILVAGDEQVGKSSLISTFVSRHFSDVVPGIMTRVRLPPDPQSKCTTTIVDSQHADAAIAAAVSYARDRSTAHTTIDQHNARDDDDDDDDNRSISSSVTNKTGTTMSSTTSLPGLESIDVVILVYDTSNPDTFHRLEQRWLPLIEQNYSGELPVILAGNKTDVTQKSQNQQQMSRSRQQIVALMQRFRFVRQYIRCSAKGLLNVDEIFLKAQQAVLYPIGPLYDLEEGRLSNDCQRAFRRIFRIYDRDRDGLLSTSELDRFQYETFHRPVYKRDIVSWKKIIQSNNSTQDEIAQDGKLTLAGFLAIFDVFVSQNLLEVPWLALRKFGYNDDLQLCIPESVWTGHAVRSASDLTPSSLWRLCKADRRFLIDTFFQFDSDDDGVLSPENIQDIFSVLPSPALPLWHPVRTPQAFDDVFSRPKLPQKSRSPSSSESDQESSGQTLSIPDSLAASGITIASGDSLPTIDLSGVHRGSYPVSQPLSLLEWMSMWHMCSAISPHQTRAELYRLGHTDWWRRSKRKRSRLKSVTTPDGITITDHLLPSRQVRVLVFGSPGSGKTAILNTLCGSRDPLYTCKTRQPESSTTFVKMMREKSKTNGDSEVATEQFAVHFVFTEVPEAQAEDQAKRKKDLAKLLAQRECDLVMLTFDATNSASLAYVKHMETTLLDDDMPRVYVATKSDQIEGTESLSTAVVDEAATHCRETELAHPLVTSSSTSNTTDRDQILMHLTKCCLKEPGVERKRSRPYEEKRRKEAARRRARKMIWLGVGVGMAVAVVGYLWTGGGSTATSKAERKASTDRFGWLRSWFAPSKA